MERICDTNRMSQNVCPLVSAEDRVRLEAIIADRNRTQKHVARAQIILHSSDRLNVAEIARLSVLVDPRSGAGSGGLPRRVSTVFFVRAAESLASRLCLTLMFSG